MKIEKHKNYKLRLMPNFFDIQKSTIELFGTTISDDPVKISKYFSYILIDDKLDFMSFGIQIKNYIQKCITGFYGTSEGYLICEPEYKKNGKRKEIKKYYANGDKSFVTINEDYYNQYKDKQDLKEYTDIEYYERMNLFDIKSRYGLSFKTREKHGFLEIYNIRFYDIEPLWKEGDDKSKITSMYDDVKKLDEYIEDYKNELIDWGNENSVEYIFGEEGKRYYMKKKFNK